MKHYAINKKIENAAANCVSFLPALSQSEPPLNEMLARFYDNNGTFLGWCDYESYRKYIYGKLYYKTKGAYTIRTKRISYDSRTNKKAYVTEKSSGLTAAYIILRPLENEDFIDKDDEASVARITHDALQAFGWNFYNLTSFPDKYNLCADLRAKFQDEVNTFVQAKKQEVLEHLLNYEKSVLVSRETLKQATEETKGEWNMNGLSF